MGFQPELFLAELVSHLDLFRNQDAILVVEKHSFDQVVSIQKQGLDALESLAALLYVQLDPFIIVRGLSLAILRFTDLEIDPVGVIDHCELNLLLIILGV